MDNGYAIPVQEGDSYRGYPTLATTPAFFREFRPATDSAWTLKSGRSFEKEFEVVLGSAAAAGTRLKLGDTIVLTHGTGASRTGGESGQGGIQAPHVHTQYKFEVVGVLAPTGTSHDRALFINLNSSWILHAFDRHEQAELQEKGGHAEEAHDHEHEPRLGVSDLTDADRLITGVYARVQTRKGTDVSAAIQPLAAELKTMGFTVASPSDQIRKLFVIVGSINQIILAMAAAVMVSSGIAIMVALYNSMEQRRRQIAVLRVLGCSRPRIFGLVVTESAILGMIGAAGGLVISVAAGLGVAGIMRERLGLIIRPTYSPDWVIGVLVGAVVLAALAGIVPAVMAYRTPVVKNLKPIG
jgi:putative ABC transport system permease protein